MRLLHVNPLVLRKFYFYYQFFFGECTRLLKNAIAKIYALVGSFLRVELNFEEAL